MKIQLNKSDAYIIGIFFLIAIPVSLVGYDYSKGLFEPIMDAVIYVVFALFVTYVIVYKFFPHFFPQKQILQLFVWTVLFMAVTGFFELMCYYWVEDNHFGFIQKNYNRFEIWFWSISTSAENAGILIGILLGKKFYDAQMDIQEREKEKRENELRLLKSQIDPHFLFNNLNTVDSLIDSNPVIAKEYLQRLAQLYRYLIRTKDDEVVMLEEELEFAKNYIFLLEKRYGKAYVFEIEGAENMESKLIPPGALQTLLENVVKHNVGESNNPVITSIVIDEDQILISNNIKEKKTSTISTNTGLENLRSRYQLLSDLKITISKDDSFTVVLPHILEVG